jgi:phage gp36-like protein
MSTPQYINLADLQAFYSAQDIAALTTAQGVDVAAVLAAVNAEMDAYVAPLRGKALLVSVPGALKLHGAAMAKFRLHRDALSVEHPAYVAWKEAIRFLERVAEGKVQLVLDLADNPDTEEDDTAATGVWSERGPNTLDAKEFGSSFW